MNEKKIEQNSFFTYYYIIVEWQIGNFNYRRPSLFSVLVFEVLTICGPENRGKPQIAREKIRFQPNLSLKSGFCYSRIVISQECNPREQRGKPVPTYSNLDTRKLLHFYEKNRDGNLDLIIIGEMKKTGISEKLDHLTIFNV